MALGGKLPHTTVLVTLQWPHAINTQVLGPETDRVEVLQEKEARVVL